LRGDSAIALGVDGVTAFGAGFFLFARSKICSISGKSRFDDAKVTLSAVSRQRNVAQDASSVAGETIIDVHNSTGGQALKG
jgi:hypothetical protein